MQKNAVKILHQRHGPRRGVVGDRLQPVTSCRISVPSRGAVVDSTFMETHGWQTIPGALVRAD
jgi:hypothetical protein